MLSPDRLNLGCGTNAVPGWVNLDGSWSAWIARHPLLERVVLRLRDQSQGGGSWRRDIVIHDVRQRLPFSASRFRAVYSSHLLEHLYRSEAEHLMKECFRVLQPGGIIRVIVPDLRTIVQEYMGGANIGKRATQSTACAGDPCERFNSRLLLRSPAPPRRSLPLRLLSIRDFHSHKWVYDESHLGRLMRAAGFCDARRRDYLDSDIEGIAEVERADRILYGEGVCVEALKPAL
jgi:SAM-dependent methyltransferase